MEWNWYSLYVGAYSAKDLGILYVTYVESVIDITS